jgi:hypothetical protein
VVKAAGSSACAAAAPMVCIQHVLLLAVPWYMYLLNGCTTNCCEGHKVMHCCKDASVLPRMVCLLALPVQLHSCRSSVHS